MNEINNINKSKECKKTLICSFCQHYQDELKDILNLKDKYDKPQNAGIGICGISNQVVGMIDGFGCFDFNRNKFKNKINIKEIEE